MRCPTPIYDFVSRYQQRRGARLHMPGHKGQGPLGCEGRDITEIPGADNLYAPDGIIAESEAYAASLFGFGATLYGTEGSSQCIKAMLYLALLDARAAGRAPVIVAARNVHKAFLHACALLDADVHWLWPETAEQSPCTCHVAPDSLETALADLEICPAAVYITSPDYLGNCQDIAALAAVCRKFRTPLLVDNAHGAYLKFLAPSRHPVDLGAAMSCDSAHKTLPVLTGGAYLHLSKEAAARIGPQAREAMALFGSSSPSYLILQSLDLCNAYLSEGYPQRLAACTAGLAALRTALRAAHWHVPESDPLRLTVEGCDRGYDGLEIAGALEAAGAVCEYADANAAVCMITPENAQEDLTLLEETLCALPLRPPRERVLFTMERPERVLSIRAAMLAPWEAVPVLQAAGRVCAVPAVICPPAVPCVVSGERIDAGMLPTLAAWGSGQIYVVR